MEGVFFGRFERSGAVFDKEDIEQTIQEQYQFSTLELYINDYGAVILAQHLSGNIQWTKLKLRGIDALQIGTLGATALSLALENNSTVTEIEVSNFGAVGATALGKALRANRTIKTMNLGDFNIGDRGALALAKALERNATVTEIDVSENHVGAVGAKALAKALRVNRTVKVISLQYNDVGDEGAAALAAALQENSSVTEISLTHNNIGDKGAVALAGAISVNSTLKSIELIGNEFRSRGDLALAASIMTKKTECRIRLDGDEVNREFLAKHGIIHDDGAIMPTMKYPVGLDVQAIQQKFGKEGAQLLDHHSFTRSNHNGHFCAVAAAVWNDVDMTLHFLCLWPEHADELLRERYGSRLSVFKSGLLYDTIHAERTEVAVKETEAIEAAVAVAEAIKGTAALSLVNVHLCGEGCAGKTMTRQALLQTLNCTTIGSFLLPPKLSEISINDGRTLGMECEATEFTGSDGAPVRALLHDYGGQLEFRANHAPHLSAPNSVYVIVVPLWDMSHDRAYELEEIVAKYTQWLKFLYTVVPNVAAADAARKSNEFTSPKLSAVLPQCLTVINFAGHCTPDTVAKTHRRLVQLLHSYNAAPGNQRLHFIDKPIVIDVNKPSEVYRELAPVLKQEIVKLSTTPIPITPCLQTVLADRAVKDRWPLFTTESQLKGLIRSAVKDKHSPLPTAIPNEATREKVLDTICVITQEMLESRRDIVVFPVHNGERISINHPNWLTNEILGSLFDPKVRPQLLLAAAMRRVDEGAEDSHLLSLQDINAAVKSKLDDTTRDMIDDNFIPRLLQHVGVCIPVVVDEGGLVRAVAEGTDASAVQHWFPSFSTIAMKKTDGAVLTGADHVIARQFKLVDPGFCIFPPGYFSSLFVSIVSLHNTTSLIKIFKNGMVLRSATDRFQIVVRQTADEKSFVVTVATVGSEPGLAFQTIQDIKKFIYCESDWRNNVRVQECGLHPTLLLDGTSIHIGKVVERLRDPKQKDEHLAFYFGLERGQPLILKMILDEVLSVARAVEQIAQALETFHDKFDVARVALLARLEDRQDVSLEAVHNLAANLDQAVGRVDSASVATSQDLSNILRILTSLRGESPACTESNRLPSADALQVLVAGAFVKPLREVRAALTDSAHLVSEQLNDLKVEIVAEVREMSAELHRVEREKLRTELQTFLDSRDEVSRATIAAQVAVLLKRLEDSANKQQDKVLEEFSQLRSSVQAVRSAQTDTAYGTYDLPPLLSVKQSTAATGFKGSVERTMNDIYRLHFICPCCGKKAASGPKGHGYKLKVTKTWVATMSKVLRCTLLVLQVLSLFGPIPLPHIADLAQYLPGDRNSAEWQALFDEKMQSLSELKDLMTELAGELGVDPFEGDIYSDSPPPESIATIPATTATSARNTHVAGPVITQEHMAMVREFLQEAKETLPLGSSQCTGLTRAMYDRTGQCAWVCKGADGKDSACKTRYIAEGNDCLVIQMFLG